jgi:hypothetical protein
MTAPGLMSAPIPETPVPALMASAFRPGRRPLMQPDPNTPFDRSRDAITFLWLLALILALVLSIGSLGQS